MFRLLCALFLLGIAQPAYSQSAACPDAITLTYDDGNRRTFEGSDHADPVVCRFTRKDGSQGRLMFNYYPLRAGSDFEAARPALQALFSGQQKQVSFRVTLQTAVQGVSGTNLYRVTWRVIAAETLTIGKTAYPTRIVDCEMQGENGNSFHNLWRFWIAEDKLLYLKGEYHLYSGFEWSGTQQHSWRVVRVTE